MNLIPAPQYIDLQDSKHFHVLSKLTVSCHTRDVPLFDLLQSRLQNHCGVEVSFRFADRDADLLVTYAPNDQPGWHRIQIEPDKIHIFSADSEGLQYALVTLFHLIRVGNIPCGIIEDWPKYEHRGQLLDTTRHFFPIDEIKRIVEQISLLKFNRLHWVFANDQAWRIESKVYPKLAESCGEQKYTWEQVRELVRYAKLRGIDIVPEFEIPGHSSAAIAAYPELCCSGRQIIPPVTGGVFSFILCGGKDTTYRFIEKILAEFLELFPSPVIHLGGDEAPKAEWENCPHCKAKMLELGLSDTEDLQAHMLNYAYAILRKHGRRAICWNECLKASNLDPGFTVQFWSDSSDKGFCNAHVNTGRKFILSNFRPLYFDYPFSVSNLKDVYRCEPNVGGTPIQKSDISGIESAIWTEHIKTRERLEYLLFPQAAASAELAWGTNRNYEDFRGRLEEYFPLFADCSISAAPIADTETTGIKRVLQNIRFAGFMIKFVFTMRKSQKQIRTTAK